MGVERHISMKFCSMLHSCVQPNGSCFSIIASDFSLLVQDIFSFSFSQIIRAMAFSNKRRMKVLSVAQIAMATIFFTLGMVDRYEVGFVQTSLMFTPCWISGLVRALTYLYQTHIISVRIYKLKTTDRDKLIFWLMML